MTKITCIFALFFILFQTQAQDISLRGKVFEESSGKGLEFANVALLSQSDSSVVAGGMTDLDGSFDFVSKPGQYILRIGFIGYDSHYQNLTLGERRTVNLGNISLRSDAANLQEVVVEGVNSIFESDIDKRRYDVENSVVAEGATASELLETLPSIQVDDEGGISMRGSGDILIYINGRPSNLSGDDAESILAQFPANSIKSVELITNPSSRYDAAGVGGIINIILKKNEKTGLNGQVNVSAGTRDKYNAGVNLNYGAGKVNYYASYNYQNRRMFRESDAFRENRINGVSPFLDQDSYGESVDINHLLRGGIDYNINENQTLGFYAQGNFRDRTGFNNLNQRSLNSLNRQDSLFVRNQNDTRESFNAETGVNYNWEIDTLGQRLFTSLSYSRDERTQVENYEQFFFNESNEAVPANNLQQINTVPQTSDLYVFQLDYIKPFRDGGSLETGLKGTFSLWDRSQEFMQGDQNNAFIPTPIDSISDGFVFNEDVYAAYMSYRNRVGKVGFQGGLRGEYTETTGTQASRLEPFVNNYFNLFPSLYLSYELGQEHEFTANYSRRISRPNMWSLSPLYRVRDLLNLSVGNPFLQPEFTDSYEFGYMKGFEKFLFNATVYHRASTNVHTRVIRLTDNNVAIQTRENALRRNATGLEVINQMQLANWWDATVSGNFFYSEIIGDNIEQGFNNSNYSWTVSLLSNMAIPNLFTFQVQGNYRGPIVLPQGQIEPFWGLNAGIRKNVMNDKGTISLNVSDIFNTRIFRITNEDNRFVQERVFNRETRIGTIAFTYRFGGFKEKSNGRRDRDDDFDDGDF
ncbi:MAG: TonB-dependent receptor [Lunatimonas sp.]|uniref:TonB-dependent receptor domain-containing protein n=1 Tax=Lunatimonas sp. TaxID=2060141 RepID=UPI00263A8A2E|nr:TonB-dependent receptor [Lunatimonas sp.]MCC5939362.1 TonB-dependent receptor [Lunatimonas sp.]